MNAKVPRLTEPSLEVKMNETPIQGESPLPRLAFVSGLGFGGSTTFLCNLAGELVRRRVPVIIVSPERENPFAADFEGAEVRVFLHDDRRTIFEDRMAAMLQTLAEFQPTTVVGCLGQTSYEVLRYLPRGVRRLAVIQTDYSMHYEASVPYAGCLDAIVGISTRITERLAEMVAFRDVTKLCLLHGVTIPATVKPRGRESEPLRILYFGRIMNPQKRVHLFPKILAVLREAGIPFQWSIVGEGDQRGELERAMPSVPGQTVNFIGAVPNAQVPALLEQHDVFLLASDAEGLPLSLLEAMAHGVVPVVSDLESGIRDVVDATNGILVPVNDVEGYARAIIHLHEHRDELAAKSAAAHERVKTEFSVQTMADRWLRVLAAPPTEVQWPSTWHIRAPLTGAHYPRFWPPMRVARRLAARFRR
jgi:glycosyltransferase involved in cell wall biosynthesis